MQDQQTSSSKRCLHALHAVQLLQKGGYDQRLRQGKGAFTATKAQAPGQFVYDIKIHRIFFYLPLLKHKEKGDQQPVALFLP